MSDDKAAHAIAMVAPRAVDVNEWLLVESSDRPAVEACIAAKWGGIRFVPSVSEKTCGALFVAELNHSISIPASLLLQHFFVRDGAEAVVFEFDKFEGDFKLRRWEQILARTR